MKVVPGVVTVVALISLAAVSQLTLAPRGNADSVVVIEGRGFGHGVGMAQDGAYWLGLSGRSATEILRTFFPGAVLAKKAGTVRVPLGSGSNFTLAFPAGGLINGTRVPAGRNVIVAARDGEVVATISNDTTVTVPAAEEDVAPVSLGTSGGRGFSVQVPDRQSSDPAVIPLTTVPPTTVPPTTAPAPELVAPTTSAAETPSSVPGPAPAGEPGLTTPPNPEPEAGTGSGSGDGVGGLPESSTSKPAGATGVTVSGSTLEAAGSSTVGFGGRRYRGSLELRLTGGSVRVVNVVDIEDYLRGMGEILTPSWPAATLQAQAIAARTYALRYMAASGEICPTQRCQVYLGAQAEYPAMDKAVAATRSKVLVYEGKLIAAFYSASGGGTIATPAEAFGGDVEIPYLKAGAYPTGDLKAWTVTMTLGEVARRVGYRGTPSGVAITEVGPSGRALTVSVYGSAGTLNVRGPSFDAALGLKSTFFTFGSGSSGALANGSSGSSVSGSSTDSSIPTGVGQVAGPVGPRIPVDSDPGESTSGVSADGSDDVLFAQSDLLTAGDPATGLAPDADLSPDDTLSAADSTETQDGTDTTAAAAATAETSSSGLEASAPVDNAQRQTLSAKSSVKRANDGASVTMMGGAAAAFTALTFSSLVLIRRRRRS